MFSTKLTLLPNVQYSIIIMVYCLGEEGEGRVKEGNEV